MLISFSYFVCCCKCKDHGGGVLPKILIGVRARAHTIYHILRQLCANICTILHGNTNKVFPVVWHTLINSRGISGWSSYTTGGKHGIRCTVTSWEYLKFQSRLPKIFGRHLGFWRPSLIFGRKMTCRH